MSAELATLAQIKHKKDFYGIASSVFNSDKQIDCSEVFPNADLKNYALSLDPFNDSSLLHKFRLEDYNDDINNNNLTSVGNPTSITGHYDKGVNLPSGTYLYNDVIQYQTENTINIWLNPNIYVNNGMFFSFGKLSSNIAFYGTTSGYLQIAQGSAAGGVLHSELKAPIGVWTCCTIILAPTYYELYINGVLDVHYNTSAVPNIEAGFSLGSIYSVADTSDAKYDQVEIFNRVLTPEEILSLYNIQNEDSRKIVLDIEDPTEYINTVSTVDNVDPFDDNSGVALYKCETIEFKDESGNYNAINNGASLSNGRFGKGLDFANDSAVASLPSLNTGRSFGGWIYSSGTNGTMLNLNDGTNTNTTRIHFNNGYFACDGIESVIYPADGNWHLVYVTETETIRNLYVDGILIGNFGISAFTLPLTLYIGNNKDLNDGISATTLDQIRVFNRALTQDEINVLYNEKIERGFYD